MAFVKLSGPAKIHGKWLKEDQVVELGFEAAVDLQVQGLVKEYSETGFPADAPVLPVVHADTRLLITDEAFQAAVEAEALKLAGQAFDGALGKLEAEAKEIAADAEKLQAENNQLLARAVEAEAQRDKALALIRDLQAAANQNTPQSEPPAETAPKKKGAAGTKG